MTLGHLRIRQDIATLLREDARNTVAAKEYEQASRHGYFKSSQQVALQPQCHWRFWLDDDAACLRDVDIQDSFSIDLLGIRARPEGRDEPFAVN